MNEQFAGMVLVLTGKKVVAYTKAQWALYERRQALKAELKEFAPPWEAWRRRFDAAKHDKAVQDYF